MLTLNIEYEFDKIADDLNSTENREPSKEAHETQLSLELDLLVSLDIVKGGRVKNISLPKNDSELLANSMRKKIMKLPKPPNSLYNIHTFVSLNTFHTIVIHKG